MAQPVIIINCHVRFIKENFEVPENFVVYLNIGLKKCIEDDKIRKDGTRFYLTSVGRELYKESNEPVKVVKTPAKSDRKNAAEKKTKAKPAADKVKKTEKKTKTSTPTKPKQAKAAKPKTEKPKSKAVKAVKSPKKK